MTGKNSAETRLPAKFEHLEPAVAAWALRDEAERRERRATASMPDLRNFYDLVGPSMVAIGAHLDGFAMGSSLPLPELRLLQLAQMYMEAAWAVEIIGSPEESDQVARGRWRVTAIPAQVFDLPPGSSASFSSSISEKT